MTWKDSHLPALVLMFDCFYVKVETNPLSWEKTQIWFKIHFVVFKESNNTVASVNLTGCNLELPMVFWGLTAKPKGEIKHFSLTCNQKTSGHDGSLVQLFYGQVRTWEKDHACSIPPFMGGQTGGILHLKLHFSLPGICGNVSKNHKEQNPFTILMRWGPND